jgi:signal transduction histidine kinase/ligand-binding sensor domain-containing protein
VFPTQDQTGGGTRAAAGLTSPGNEKPGVGRGDVSVLSHVFYESFLVEPAFHFILKITSMTLQFRWNVIVLLLICSPLSTVRADDVINGGTIQPLRFAHPTDFTPLAHSHIQAIAQDRQGFMWFGTELGGLCRYDGYDFKIYQHDPNDIRSLSHNYVITLYVDRTGTLWVGFNGGGLDRYDRRTDTFVHFQYDAKDTNSFPHATAWTLFEDHTGTLWIGGGSGLSRYDRKSGTFFTYRHDSSDTNSLADNSVRAILEDPETGLFWIGTRRGGLDLLDPATGRFTHFSHDPKNRDSLGGDGVSDIRKDRTGNLWISTVHGLDRFNPKTKTFAHYVNDPRDPGSIAGNDVLKTVVDSQGRFWVATLDGLDRFDSDTGRFIHYRHNRADADSISDDSCSNIFEDDAGGLWFSTIAGGVNRLAPDAGKFAIWQHDPDNATGLANDAVLNLCADHTGNVWIATSKGLNVFDGHRFQVYHNNPFDPQSLSSDTVTAILDDPRGSIWVAAGGVLNRFDGHGFTHYPRGDVPEGGTPARINSMQADSRGRLWLSLQAVGLTCFDGTNFTTYRWEMNNLHAVPSRYIYPLVPDDNGGIWMGCADMGLVHFDPDKNEFTTYLVEPAHPGMEAYNRVYSICAQTNGILWIGANQGLFQFDIATKTFTRHYTKTDGLPANTVVAIRRDDLGRLWLGTPAGLSRFDPRTGEARNYDESDGLPGSEFRRDITTVTADQRMFFAGPKGLVAFYPGQMRNNPHVPPVVLTGFDLFDKPAEISENSPLHEAINVARGITLKYEQSVVTFQFAALDYTLPAKNHYEYKLEGFDPEWRKTDATKRYATYTKLPAGRYVFRVRGANNDGLWNTNGTALSLIVTPAWWATWWFRLMIATAVMLLMLAAIRLRVRHLKTIQHELELQVAQRTQELSRAKQEVETANRSLEEKVQARTTELLAANAALQQQIAERKRAEEQFRQSQKMEAFGQLAAGVAHDFNNVLTIIQGNLSLIIAAALSKERQAVALDHAYEASERAATLTRQLLTFGRRQPFQPADVDLNEVVANIARLLQRLIGEHIKLEKRYAPGNAPVCVDPALIEQALINLVVNARDAMPRGGKLLLQTSAVSFSQNDPNGKTKQRAGDFICLSVHDNGHGIPPEDLPHIFEPFFTTKEVGRGTGLGLATVFGIVEQHHGWIEVDSRPNSGSTFHIYLPRSAKKTVALEKTLEPVPIHGGNETILIVEDELPVREFMAETLTRHGYRVHEAASGVSARKLWRTHRDTIDLLITDMVMPEGVGGRELADELRSQKPGLKVIFCSGYTDEILGEDSLLRDKVNFLDKPFELRKFLTVVRRCLDAP